MIVRIYKSNQPLVILALFLYALVFLFLSWDNNGLVSAENASHTPLYGYLFKWVGPYLVLRKVLAFLILLLNALLLNFIVNEHEIIGKQTYLPAFFYVFTCTLFPVFFDFHPVLFVHFFLLIAYQALVNSYKQNRAFSLVFTAGFFVGLATLFYAVSFFFFFFIWAGLLLLRPFSWREWVIPVLGLLLPYLFIGVYYFYFDRLHFFLTERLFSSFLPASLPHLPADTMSRIALFSFCGLILLACWHWLSHGSYGKLKPQKAMVLLLWMGVFSLPSLFFASLVPFIGLLLPAISIGVFLSSYFLHLKKAWLGETLFLLLFSLVLYGYIKS